MKIKYEDFCFERFLKAGSIKCLSEYISDLVSVFQDRYPGVAWPDKWNLQTYPAETILGSHSLVGRYSVSVSSVREEWEIRFGSLPPRIYGGIVATDRTADRDCSEEMIVVSRLMLDNSLADVAMFSAGNSRKHRFSLWKRESSLTLLGKLSDIYISTKLFSLSVCCSMQSSIDTSHKETSFYDFVECVRLLITDSGDEASVGVLPSKDKRAFRHLMKTCDERIKAEIPFNKLDAYLASIGCTGEEWLMAK